MLAKKDTDFVSAWQHLTVKKFLAVDGPKAALNLSPRISCYCLPVKHHFTKVKVLMPDNRSSSKLAFWVKKFLILGIKVYQALSHTLFFRNCRFYPSCSQYALDAVERFGIARGVKKAICRILRCSPLTDGGYDPVI